MIEDGEEWDVLWEGVDLATMRPDGEPWGAIPDGALAVREGRIAWVGSREAVPDGARRRAGEVRDGRGAWMTPAFVDCHTHLVFGGDRADEFERRLRGESYEEIARSGGGIRSTVRATRGVDEDALFSRAAARLRALLDEGVTTVEVKSGYGLDVETELRMLRVARRLGRELPVTVRATLLGAHAVPAELEGDRDGYLRTVTAELIPRALEEGLADAVDVFCDSVAFTPDECERVLRAGQEHGLALRLHADQLSDAGGAALAARMGARSADHLEHTGEDGVRAMARAGTVAVLLPGAYCFLGGGRRPPVDLFRTYGVPLALATDLNPGTSPVHSPLLILNLGCALFGLTPEEAVAGITRTAAHVLGLDEERGTLEPGKAADLVLWDVGHPRELAYWMGRNPRIDVVREGVVLETGEDPMPG